MDIFIDKFILKNKETSNDLPILKDITNIDVISDHGITDRIFNNIKKIIMKNTNIYLFLKILLKMGFGKKAEMAKLRVFLVKLCGFL